MLSTRLALSLLLALILFPVGPARAAFPGTIPAPDGKGDQIVFYYDARDAFTTFINLRNESAAELVVSVLFYGPDVGTPFARTVMLPAAALTILDTNVLKQSGLPAQFGVAIATAVDGSGAAVVTRALSGNFTVANLRTQSAWGAAGAARSAIQKSSIPGQTTIPNPGTVIDGSSVALPPIQPTSANLAAYYDPDTLAPAADGGNQLIFISFEDVAGTPYSAASALTSWSVAATRNTGEAIGSSTFVADGVAVSDLVSVAGAGVLGASGSVVFAASRTSHAVTRLIYFSESLGTFGTGYLLPRGRPATTPQVPTPTPTATP